MPAPDDRAPFPFLTPPRGLPTLTGHKTISVRTGNDPPELRYGIMLRQFA